MFAEVVERIDQDTIAVKAVEMTEVLKDLSFGFGGEDGEAVQVAESDLTAAGANDFFATNCRDQSGKRFEQIERLSIPVSVNLHDVYRDVSHDEGGFGRDPFFFFEFKGSITLSVSLPCLLYTSPSPRDRQKYRMPSSA